ncbi:MAG: Zn-ribbon domain-containing OB-fold protein [Sulfolobaceae archaeon]
MQIDAIPLNLRYTIEYPREYIEGLKKGEILATKCKKCGEIYYPPQLDCANCKSSDMEWFSLSKEGELMTYSIVVQKPQGFENYSDYIVGIVKNKDGIGLMCWVKGKPKVGSKVRLTTDGLRVIAEVIE